MGQKLSRGKVSELSDKFMSLEFGGQYFEKGIQLEHVMPAWNGVLPLIFNIVPEFDAENVLPAFYRDGGVLQPSNFFMRVPEAKYIGSQEKVSFLLFDPFLESKGHYEAASNPYYYFRRRIMQASKTDQYKGWKIYFESKDDKLLPSITWHYFFQVVCWQRAEGWTLDENRQPFGIRKTDKYLSVLSVSKSTGDIICKMLRDRVESGQPDYLTGDDPCYFVLFNPEKVLPATYLAPDELQKMSGAIAELGVDIEEDAEHDAGAGLVESEDSEFKKYKLVIHSNPIIQSREHTVAEMAKLRMRNKRQQAKLPKQPLSSMFTQIRGRYRPFDELLTLPTHDEQVALICRGFADRADMIRVGFMNSPFEGHPAVQKILNRKLSPVVSSTISDEIDGGGSVTDIEELDMGTDSLVDEETLNAAFGPVDQFQAARNGFSS